MVTRVRFRKLADRLINKTFGDFRDAVVFTTVGDYDYTTQDTAGDDPAVNTLGIRVNYSKSEVDGSKIQASDYKVIVQQQGLGVDVRSDNVEMTFKGVEVTIESVNEDAAQAVYTLQVREK
jgi:hypothetical protein